MQRIKFYDSVRFNVFDLPPAIQEQISLNPQACSLEYLNRRLLEIAYPREVAKYPFSRTKSDIGAHGGPTAGPRLRPRVVNRQVEVVVLGAVPGHNYEIRMSTDFMTWNVVKAFRIEHLGDYITFLLEPRVDGPAYAFFRLQ